MPARTKKKKKQKTKIERRLLKNLTEKKTIVEPKIGKEIANIFFYFPFFAYVK